MGHQLGPLSKPEQLGSLEEQAEESPSLNTAGAGWPWKIHVPELGDHGTTRLLCLIPPIRKGRFSFALQFGHFTDALLAMIGRVWAAGGSGGHELPCASHRWFWVWHERLGVCHSLGQLEEPMGPSAGVFWKQHGLLLWGRIWTPLRGLWQQATKAGAGTLLSDCHQHSRAVQEKAVDVFLARAFSFCSLQTWCLVACVLNPCSQRHSSCSDTPAEDPSPCPSLHCPGVMHADLELARGHQAEFLTSVESIVWASGSEILPSEQVNQSPTCQCSGLWVCSGLNLVQWVKKAGQTHKKRHVWQGTRCQKTVITVKCMEE